MALKGKRRDGWILNGVAYAIAAEALSLILQALLVRDGQTGDELIELLRPLTLKKLDVVYETETRTKEQYPGADWVGHERECMSRIFFDALKLSKDCIKREKTKEDEFGLGFKSRYWLW